MNIEQELAYSKHALAEALAENAQLRKKLSENSRHARRVRQAYQDALLLSLWRAGGIIPSRRFAEAHGITRRRWQNAVALLRIARVIVRDRTWQILDATIIQARLDKAMENAIDVPGAFHCRMPASDRRNDKY
ncbi:hypothetical protein BH10CHL1_BH10CHL1_24330 [soil metagenome]